MRGFFASLRMTSKGKGKGKGKDKGKDKGKGKDKDKGKDKGKGRSKGKGKGRSSAIPPSEQSRPPGTRFAMRLRWMRHSGCWVGGRRTIELRSMPRSQNRDMGHPAPVAWRQSWDGGRV
jgi:hypothetical protein